MRTTVVKLVIILFIWMVFISCGGCASVSNNWNDWSRHDTYRQVGVTAMLAADAYTTSKIQYEPGHYEAGPIAREVLGLHPSTSSTYQYFAVNMIGNYVIARSLPPKWRKYWQGWEMAVHGAAVWNNCNLGLCK